MSEVPEHRGLNFQEKLLFEKAIVRPPSVRPIHMHDEACFLYVLEGKLNTFSENSSESLTNKEAVLMKCGNFVGRIMPGESSEVYHAVAVHFYPEVLREIYGDEIPSILKKPASSSVQLAKIPVDEMLTRYIESILFYFENPALASEEILKLKVKELIILLSNTKNADSIRSILSNLFSPVSFSFRELIDAHKYSPVSTADLAKLANMSLSSFKREFAKVFNDSPGNYLRQAKLKKAASLLTVSDENIGHIAWDCGFQDISHFSRLFKSEYGISPSEFRKNQNHK